MQGHIRRRSKGGRFEYIIDIGEEQAQRCQDCRRRFWVERQPLASCPRCGGKLQLGSERRRQTKAGFANRKEARAAMNKVLAALAERSYVAPTKVALGQFLTDEWLSAIESTVRLTTYRSYVQHVKWHITPHLGEVALSSLSGAQINGLYATLASRGRRGGEAGLSPQTVRHVHAVLHRALRDAVRWGLIGRNPIDSADPPRPQALVRCTPGVRRSSRPSCLSTTGSWTRRTAFALPAGEREIGIQAVYSALARDGERNRRIVADVLDTVTRGRSPLLLTERTEHRDLLAATLRESIAHVFVVAGAMSTRARHALVEAMQATPRDEPRLVVATGRCVGEGFDDARLDTLFLAIPIAWKGTLQQYAGRLHRSHAGKAEVVIYDYVDEGVPVLVRMHAKRLAGYRAMGYQVGGGPEIPTGR